MVSDTMTGSTPPFDLLNNDPPSANEDVAKLRLKLNHLSLSELESKRLVKWNKDEHVVDKGDCFDKIQIE